MSREELRLPLLLLLPAAAAGSRVPHSPPSYTAQLGKDSHLEKLHRHRAKKHVSEEVKQVSE